jgi:trans-aconitate methyltransferase
MSVSSTSANSYVNKVGAADKERLDLQAQLANIPLREAVAKWTDRLEVDSILSLLDFGCGAGSSIEELRKQFPKATYIGLDRSEEQIAVAGKAHPNECFVVGDEKSQAEIAKADLVYMQFVAMHQDNLEIFFSNVVAGMKPGAQLLIFEPYSDISRVKADNPEEIVASQIARFKMNAEIANKVGRRYNAVEHYPDLLKALGMEQIDVYRKENMCFQLRTIRTILVSNWENAKDNERFRSYITVDEVERHVAALKQAPDDTILYLGDTRILIAQKPL